jgi:hypothetical protein
MYPKDADSLRTLVELFRERRASRTVVVIADDDDQDPPGGAHHGHSRRPRPADIVQFPGRRR